MENNNQQSTKSKALPLFIILFLASLALSAFLFFKYAKNAKKIQEQNEELTIAYSVLQLDKDSIQERLNFVERQLQDRINENLAQADLKEELREQLEAKKRSLSAAHRRITRLLNGEEGTASSVGGPRNLAEAQKAISNLQQSNAEYMTKVEQIQKDYKAAQALAQQNALRASTLGIQKDSLVQVNTVINKKLSTASILRIAGLKVEPIRERKGEQEAVEKARKVERLKINFTTLGSELTVKEDKEIIIRIKAPNGTVLTKNTNKLTDTDELFTLKNTIEYDGTEKGITYYYQQEAEYAKGIYKVELLHNDIVLDRKSFSLR